MNRKVSQMALSVAALTMLCIPVAVGQFQADFSDLRPGQRANLIYALMVLEPDSVQAIVASGDNAEYLSNEAYNNCAAALRQFSDLISGGWADVSELEEIAANHGWDPSIASDIALGNQETRETVRLVAAAASIVQIFAIGDSQGAVNSNFYKRMIETSQIARWGCREASGDLPFGLSEDLERRCLRDMLNSLQLQAGVVTELVC